MYINIYINIIQPVDGVKCIVFIDDILVGESDFKTSTRGQDVKESLDWKHESAGFEFTMTGSNLTNYNSTSILSDGSYICKYRKKAVPPVPLVPVPLGGN
jgi:hypothetical protein